MHSSPLQSPLTAEDVQATVTAFRARLGSHRLPEAMHDYVDVMDATLLRSLEGRAPACAAGCSVCCHQPLLVGFLELAWLYFSDEARFSSPAFVRRVEAECAYLARLRRTGLREPVALAARQFADARPCLFLNPDGACSVHAVRPFLCRNAYAWTRCTRRSLGVFGYGDLAVLGRRLRADIHAHFDLSRFDPPETPGMPSIRTATATFYLPEGLRFLRERVALDELRPLFVPPPPP